MKRVAVIGSGIAGLSAAWSLSRADWPGGVQVTLFEAGRHFGGHANTVDVTLPDAQGRPLTHGVDTGFLVFNEKTYPALVALFKTLKVRTAPSEMSFSVQSPQGLRAGAGPLEWSGRDLNGVFTQRRNLVSGAFWCLLKDLVRFNRLTTDLAVAGQASALTQSLGDFLDEHRLSESFRQGYLLPMLGCIWSCPTDQMLKFPVATLIRFCHNHGLLQITDRPQWHTVEGGSRHYVRAMVADLADARLETPVQAVRAVAGGVAVNVAAQTLLFDEVVLACHTDQALALLGAEASVQEREVLGAIRYQPNRAVLHTDPSVLPSQRRAWAAWNYERGTAAASGEAPVCLHYWINRLQPLPWAQPVVVSLNPVREPAAASVLGEFAYAHPVFDLPAMAAQARVPSLQGHQHRWYCGAWMGYGFHEDGLKAGLAVAQQVLAAWQVPAKVAA